ncbi:MAG: ZPR1 zinc finger domain-containing protein [Euryarchaeota archaeon]|nr:ZPR1 zinc finger domain-containing protein [Euryarchaeota archaeon]
MKIDCPVCKRKSSLEFTTKTDNIPFFGDIMESVIKCQECGYRHSDIICLERKDPMQYSLVLDKDNLKARVIKSQSTTLSIPELGLKVEPGPQSQGYVSNVEGVLNRFNDAVKTAQNFAESKKIKDNAAKILEEIEKIKIGKNKVTLIVGDPFGHSMIIHKDAIKRELNEDEIKKLKTGFNIIAN